MGIYRIVSYTNPGEKDGVFMSSVQKRTDVILIGAGMGKKVRMNGTMLGRGMPPSAS